MININLSYDNLVNFWVMVKFKEVVEFATTSHVSCSIVKRNTVDFIDPLRNQIEWPNTVSIVWGPLRLKRGKSEFRGSHLK